MEERSVSMKGAHCYPKRLFPFSWEGGISIGDCARKATGFETFMGIVPGKTLE